MPDTWKDISFLGREQEWDALGVEIQDECLKTMSLIIYGLGRTVIYVGQGSSNEPDRRDQDIRR